MSKYQNKYRVETIRHKEWDYSSPWWYFVTINTKGHINMFGDIVNENMVLNNLGNVVDKYWKDIPVHFSNVELDYHVIMPNHIHGIIIMNPVETLDRASLRIEQPKKQTTLGIVINQFKSSFKRWCNNNGYKYFKWQSRYYDRIIRNEKELYNIRRYIEQNPVRWYLEKNTPRNLGV